MLACRARTGDATMNVWKPIELALAGGARLAWPLFQAVNRQFERRSFHPKWSPAPLLKSAANAPGRRSAGRAPPIRSVPSASARRAPGSCPAKQSIESLVNEHVGEIKASILERDGKIIVEKTCPIHGTFVDTLAINPAFLERLESLFPGRDFKAVTDTLHNHGTSSIKHGRGAVLTIDLTNRCNMMCDPCFMDANQVGYVHELTLRRGQAAARRCGEHQAAAADDGAVLGRRADDFADLSGAGSLRARGRLFQRPGRDQRHPLRAGARVCAAGRARRACASPTCSSTA